MIDISILRSFQDIEGWMSGVDNGRAGCGQAGNCPRVWVGPFFNSTREDSYGILEGLGAVTMGEQKIGPYPHWTVSTQTAGKRYEHVTLPLSEWYVGSYTIQALEEHTISTMRAAVDFYYDVGALINIYTHYPSESGYVQGEYVRYCAAKPHIWAANSVGVYDWWWLRSGVSVIPTYVRIGETVVAKAVVTGVMDSDTAIEIAIPDPDGDGIASTLVFLDDSPTTSDNYRITENGVKVKIGASASEVEVMFQTSILPGDFDGDCDVDGADLSLLARNINMLLDKGINIMSPSTFVPYFGIADCQ